MEVNIYKSIRLFVTFVLLLALLSTLTGSASAARPAPKAKWTVMVYISGDNNLESYVVPDIETELGAVGSSADVQVIALADRAPGHDTSRGDWQTTKLFRVTQGMLATPENAVADWGERNFGDPQTLVDFVTWTKANYPADRYALYFWGHGWNWHPGYVMLDDTDADTLDYEEMKAALPSIGFIDMIGYDGCNMASIEIFDLWHGYATSQSATDDKTWSAVAVDSRLDALIAAVDQWSLALNGGLAANRKKYNQAFGATQTFWQAPMDKDLYDMAYEVNQLVSDANIKSKSQAVMNAVDAVVLHERHVNAYSEAHGITIYHISKASQKDSDYFYYRSTIDFALLTAWDEFLEAYAKYVNR